MNSTNHQRRKMNTLFLMMVIVCVVVSTIYTQFNILDLVNNFDQFIYFLTHDFLPPAMLDK